MSNFNRLTLKTLKSSADVCGYITATANLCVDGKSIGSFESHTMRGIQYRTKADDHKALLEMIDAATISDIHSNMSALTTVRLDDGSDAEAYLAGWIDALITQHDAARQMARIRKHCRNKIVYGTTGGFRAAQWRGVKSLTALASTDGGLVELQNAYDEAKAYIARHPTSAIFNNTDELAELGVLI